MGERKGGEIATHELDHGRQSVRAISAAKFNHHKSAEIAKQHLICHRSIRLRFRIPSHQANGTRASINEFDNNLPT